MKLLIKNGLVINAFGSQEADVYIEDGKIKKLLSRKTDNYKNSLRTVENGCKIIDATGKYVLPGAIDAHTHFNLPVSGTVSADDYFTGSKAAACGGVTTFFDYPTQEKGTSILETIKNTRKAIEGEACVDYAIHCCITDLLDGQTFEDMKYARNLGVSSYKCYMVYPDIRVDNPTLGKILEGAREAGAIINVHAEDFYMLGANLSRLEKDGWLNPYAHYLSRDEEVESKAVKDVVDLSIKANAPVYIVHTSSREGLKVCVAAKNQGHPVYVETCPHYLYFTRDVFKREDGVNYICSPPMKGVDSRYALWAGIKNGHVDTVATDHCPFKLAEKAWGKDDFRKTPNGLMGVETMYPFMLTRANEGDLEYEKVVEMCCANPARIFGCKDKGRIEPGKDADIVIYNPDGEHYVNLNDMHSNCDYTVWEGSRMRGKIEKTFLRGELIYDGEFLGNKGQGKYVSRVAALEG